MIELALAILYKRTNDLNFGTAKINLKLYVRPFQIALNCNFNEIFNFIMEVEVLHIRSEVHILNIVVKIDQVL